MVVLVSCLAFTQPRFPFSTSLVLEKASQATAANWFLVLYS